MRERFLLMYPLGAFTVYHAARDERKITLRAHTSVVLLYLCCWRCGDTLFRCIVRVCLRVMHTVYVEPVRCWSYILEKPFRYFVRFSLLTACHASWRQRGTWNRFLDGPWNGPKIWWPFHCPSICFIITQMYCVYIVQLWVCTTVFGNLAASPSALFLREGTPTFYLVFLHKTSLSFSCSACAIFTGNTYTYCIL